jgi:hypothetical protein
MLPIAVWLAAAGQGRMRSVAAFTALYREQGAIEAV